MKEQILAGVAIALITAFLIAVATAVIDLWQWKLSSDLCTNTKCHTYELRIQRLEDELKHHEGANRR